MDLSFLHSDLVSFLFCPSDIYIYILIIISELVSYMFDRLHLYYDLYNVYYNNKILQDCNSYL